MNTAGLEAKISAMSREDLEVLAVLAMFHLRCVSGSRNSFLNYPAGALQRDPRVEGMHRDAVMFLRMNDA